MTKYPPPSVELTKLAISEVPAEPEAKVKDCGTLGALPGTDDPVARRLVNPVPAPFVAAILMEYAEPLVRDPMVKVDPELHVDQTLAEPPLSE